MATPLVLSPPRSQGHGKPGVSFPDSSVPLLRQESAAGPGRSRCSSTAASPGALLQSWAPAAALLAKVKRATCAPGKCSGLPARHPPHRVAYSERREGREKTLAQVSGALSLVRRDKPPWGCVSEPPSTGRTVAGGAWPVKVRQCRHEAQS